MSQINHILNDESYNDKQLVKEISVYVKNHIVKNLPIDEYFIKDIVDIVLRNSEIDFNKIVFTNDERVIAGWHNDYRILYANAKKIIDFSEIVKEGFALKTYQKIVTYFVALETVIHELTHARQCYLMNNDANNIYSSSIKLKDINPISYEENHGIFLVERYAHLRGYTLAYEVLSYIFPERHISELRVIIYSYLMYGYKIDNFGEIVRATNVTPIYESTKIISALENYNNIMKDNSLDKVEINLNEEIDLYDKLYLGLPINLEEYIKLRDLSKRLPFEVGTVKKLIRKL